MSRGCATIGVYLLVLRYAYVEYAPLGTFDSELDQDRTNSLPPDIHIYKVLGTRAPFFDRRRHSYKYRGGSRRQSQP